MVTRGLCAFFISPTLGFGSAVVTECFFAHERAQKMGWWTLMITIGAPTGPFITGFVVQYLSTQWMFWIFAIINAIQFLAYAILGGETLHSPEWPTNEEHYSRHLTAFCPRRINPTPFCLNEFCHFLTLSIVPEVVVPSFSYTVVFCYVTIAPLIEMPIAIGERFHLDAQQTGLQFLAMLIGSILGELISGPVSDLFQKRRSRKYGIGFEDPSVATNRLQISYIGFVASIVGLIVWGVCIAQASSQWTVKPLVGGAIAAFGNQVITTTLVTYAVDCHRERSQEIGIYVNFVRQIYGFIGPFYLPLMFETLGYSGSGCLMAGLVGLFAFVPIAILHYVKSR
jgi:MFS family permease